VRVVIFQAITAFGTWRGWERCGQYSHFTESICC